MNLWFLPSSSYYHKDFALKQPFSRAERDRYVSEFISIRKVIDYFNQTHAKLPVLLTHEAANAGLDGIVYENHWHQPTTFLKLREATDLPSMVSVMQGWNLRYFIGRKPMPDGLAEPPVLAEFLAKCALPEFEVGDYYLSRIEPGCGAKRITEPAIVVRPGYYGDDDPAIVYLGEWKQDPPGNGPDRQTRTRAEAPGAQVSFAFDGKALYYVYTRGPEPRDRERDHRRRAARRDRHVLSGDRLAAQDRLLLFRAGTPRDRGAVDGREESGVEGARHRRRFVFGGAVGVRRRLASRRR